MNKALIIVLIFIQLYKSLSFLKASTSLRPSNFAKIVLFSAEKIEAENMEFQKRYEKASKAAEESLEKERKEAREFALSLNKNQPVLTPKPSNSVKLDTSSESKIEAKSGFTETQGAFDYGLLIAFPIMIGTLGFFLFFPYIAPMLASQSP